MHDRRAEVGVARQVRDDHRRADVERRKAADARRASDDARRAEQARRLGRLAETVRGAEAELARLTERRAAVEVTREDRRAELDDLTERLAMATDQADSPHRMAPRIHCESYFACAEIDKWAPRAAIDKLAASLRDAGTPHRIEWYPGVEHGFVRKAGAWYTYDGDQLGQGKENARSFLRDNPDLADELEKKIKEKLGVGPQVDKPAEPAEAEVAF